MELIDICAACNVSGKCNCRSIRYATVIVGEGADKTQRNFTELRDENWQEVKLHWDDYTYRDQQVMNERAKGGCCALCGMKQFHQRGCGELNGHGTPLIHTREFHYS